MTGEVIGFEATRYTGNIPLKKKMVQKDYTNVLGNKYDVSNDNVDLVKEVNGEEYILADIPAENTKRNTKCLRRQEQEIYILKKN